MLLLGAAGCGFSSGADPNPPADLARSALDASLNAWKAGKKPGNVEGAEPSVSVVDRDWSAGNVLSSFKIVREEPSDTDKRFTVKLVQGKPAAEKEVRYVVVGRDPVLVFREEDYAQSINMDVDVDHGKQKRKR